MSELQFGAVVLSVGGIFHGHYEVISCLKAGGMGAVYQVLDHRTRRRRALKIMLPSIASDPDFRARFKLEATITSEIDSEHIVETFDAGVDPDTGAPFLVMELLKGEDVGCILEKRGHIPAPEVILWLYQVALALERTHAAGVVHRDLKPENLFITKRDDGSPRLKVLDFGIAKLVAQSSSANTTRNMGTPIYMSPEQIQGEGTIGPRADLYALGHIAYSLLVGQGFWTVESKSSDALFAFFAKVLQGPKEPASARAARSGVTLSPAFDAWFARATAGAAEERHASALELVEALAGALELSLPTPYAQPARPPEPLPMASSDASAAVSSDPLRVSKRSGLPIVIGGIAAACAIAAVAFALRTKSEPAPANAPPPLAAETAAPLALPIAVPIASVSPPAPAPEIAPRPELAVPASAPRASPHSARKEAPPAATSAARSPAAPASAAAVAKVPIDPTDTR